MVQGGPSPRTRCALEVMSWPVCQDRPLGSSGPCSGCWVAKGRYFSPRHAGPSACRGGPLKPVPGVASGRPANVLSLSAGYGLKLYGVGGRPQSGPAARTVPGGTGPRTRRVTAWLPLSGLIAGRARGAQGGAGPEEPKTATARPGLGCGRALMRWVVGASSRARGTDVAVGLLGPRQGGHDPGRGLGR